MITPGLNPPPPQVTPPANRVLPFTRGPVAPVLNGPAPPLSVPGGRIPLSPIPPVSLQPVDPVAPLDPGRILPPGLELPTGPAAPALPAAVDAANDLLDPFSPAWNEAPWQQPNTPASLVPPTEVPTGFFPAPDIPKTYETHAARVYVINRRPGGEIIELQFTTVQTGYPIGWREYREPFAFAPGAPVRNTKVYVYIYENTSGQTIEEFVTRTIPADGNEPGGDRDVGNRKVIFWPVLGEVEFDEEEMLETPPPPQLLIPPIAPPFLPGIPVQPNTQPSPFPDIPIDPDIQPAQPEEPDPDPIPLIPLPIPFPVNSPELQQVPPTQPLTPAQPAQPATPDLTPIPAPGSDPETKTERKLPPVPFDFCELDCLTPEPCEPVVLLKRRSAPPSFTQNLDFSTSTLGKFCDPLPQRIASIAVDVTSFSPNLKRFTSVDNGDAIGQFGTLSLVLDGRAIQDYTLARFERSVIEIPYSESVQYQILVAPIFGVLVTITDLGDRWGFYRVSGSSQLPIIDSSVLI